MIFVMKGLYSQQFRINNKSKLKPKTLAWVKREGGLCTPSRHLIVDHVIVHPLLLFSTYDWFLRGCKNCKGESPIFSRQHFFQSFRKAQRTFFFFQSFLSTYTESGFWAVARFFLRYHVVQFQKIFRSRLRSSRTSQLLCDGAIAVSRSYNSYLKFIPDASVDCLRQHLWLTVRRYGYSSRLVELVTSSKVRWRCTYMHGMLKPYADAFTVPPRAPRWLSAIVSEGHAGMILC